MDEHGKSDVPDCPCGCNTPSPSHTEVGLGCRMDEPLCGVCLPWGLHPCELVLRTD